MTELNPNHVGAAVELTNLLERYERGRAFAPGAELRDGKVWRQEQYDCFV